jgi:CopG family transcriptional regulator, nickel-responsive regulator
MERFTISLDNTLAQAVDHWIADRGYANRSEAVRDLFRAEMERTRQERDESLHCVACLSYVFNHHQRELTERITGLQHDHHDLTVSTMHAHLDHDHCLETVILRGPTAAVKQFADAVCAERGVHHGKLNLISVALEPVPGHVHGPGHTHPHAEAQAAPGKAGKSTARGGKSPRGSTSGQAEAEPGRVHLHMKPLS